jgi:hypothetical protein
MTDADNINNNNGEVGEVVNQPGDGNDNDNDNGDGESESGSGESESSESRDEEDADNNEDEDAGDDEEDNKDGNDENNEESATTKINPEVARMQAMVKASRTQKRLYKGSKRSEIFKYGIVPLREKETVFALQEYVREVIRSDPINVEACISIPKDIQDSNIAFQLEVMKYFLIEVGYFVVYVSRDCDASRCKKMQATMKFMYRCSAHRKPQDCSAIQYCIHTLDLFTEKLNAKEYVISFKIPAKRAKKDMSDLCRRVYRIFAHAFYHHQSLFKEYEAKHLLCTRFIAFFRKYQLVPRELFSREIQIPSNSLYMNPSNRKQKIAHYYELQAQEQAFLSNTGNSIGNSSHNSNNNNGFLDSSNPGSPMNGKANHDNISSMMSGMRKKASSRHLQKLSSDNFMKHEKIVELDATEVF